jgi:hypothetical protein
MADEAKSPSGTNSEILTRQQRRAAERAHGRTTCLACDRKFGSRGRYLKHVEFDHGIPRDHRWYDFEGIIYDVTAIHEIAEAGAGKYGPYTMPLTPEIMWSISGCSLDEDHIRSLSPADLAKPVLGVNHESFGYFRLIDGHHRITRLHRDGATAFSLFLVPEADVKNCFRVVRPPRRDNQGALAQLIKP